MKKFNDETNVDRLFNVKSGTIENADIVVKNGGVLNISDNAKIYLRSTGGNIKSEIGATVNIYSSSIE